MYCCYTTLGNIGCGSKGLSGQSYTWMHKTDALSLSGYASLIFVNTGTKIDWCYYRDAVWCSRCCRPFVPVLVTLTYSTSIVRVRRSSYFSVKRRNSLLHTYGLQIVMIHRLLNMRCYAGLCLSDASSRLDRSEAVLQWHTERTATEYRWWWCRRMAEET